MRRSTVLLVTFRQLFWLRRDVGRLFSVNRMLSFDSVKSRLEKQESLSFLEFNYMIPLLKSTARAL